MPPAITFFPSASGSGEFWRPVTERLPSDWDTRLLSWPGAGAEPHDPEVTSYEDLIRFAALHPDGGDVVAQSMGGLVAIGLALTFPTKLRRLVLVATSGGLDVESHATEDWRAEYAREFPEAGEWVSRARVDYTTRLPEISAPTCLIWGDDDPISPTSVARALHDALPASVLHVLSGANHMLARERPDDVTRLVIEHLR